MPSGLAFLAGLGQGASTLGASMNQRKLLEEQQRRQAAQDAMQRLTQMRQMGAVKDTGLPTAGDFEGTLEPGSLTSGGGALGALVEAARKAQAAERFTLPDAQGNLDQFRIDESLTPEAKAMKRLERQTQLGIERDNARPETFGLPFVGRDDTGNRRFFERGNRGTSRAVEGVLPPDEEPQAPVRGTPEYLKMLADEERIRSQFRAEPRAPQAPRLPASAVKELGAYDAIMGMGNDVKAALQGAVKNNVDVTGRVAGVVKTPSWFKNMTGKGGDVGKDVRGLIGNLYATLAKERGGTALSENEIRLLESYIPNENEDEGTAIVKANRFVREIDRLKKAKLAALQKYGGFTFDDAIDVREGDQFVVPNKRED